MNGSFQENPTKANYKVTWDVGIVLNNLKKYLSLRDLCLPRHSEKLAILFLLATGHPVQTMCSKNINNINYAPDGI